MISSDIFSNLKAKLVQTNKNRPTFFSAFEKSSASISMSSFLEEGIFDFDSLKKLLAARNIKLIFRSKEDSDNTDKVQILNNSLKSIKKKAKLLQEERNSSPLFFGAFFLEGIIDNDAKNVFRAPLILLPIEIDINGAMATISFRSQKDALINNSLLYTLANSRGNVWNFQELDEKFLDENFDRKTYLEELVAKSGWLISKESLNSFNELEYLKTTPGNKEKVMEWLTEVKRLKPGDQCLLSNYCSIGNFDVGDSSIFAAYNLLQEKDGDEFFKELIYKNVDVILERKNDFSEKKVKTISELDFKQKNAILTALNESVYIQGPPGTGKSQTIVNLLANIMSKHKKTIFVTEKKVASDVVYDRMGKLKTFCLQLNSKDIRQELASQIKNICEEVKNKLNLLESKNDNNIDELIEQEFEKVIKYKNLFQTEDGILYVKLLGLLKDKFNNLDANLVSKFAQNKNLIELIKKLIRTPLRPYIDQLLSIACTLHKNLFTKKFFMHKFLSSSKNCEIYFYNQVVKNKFSFKVGMFQNKKFKNFIETKLQNTNFQKWEFFTERFDADSLQLVFKIINIIKSNTTIASFDSNALIEIFCEFFATKNKEILSSFNATQNNKIKNLLYKKTKDDAESIYNNHISYICKKIRGKGNQGENQDNELYDDFNKLYRQAGNVKTGMLVKTYFKNFKNLMELFFPIIICSPESISHTGYLPLEKEEFDYAIFDEASQIFFERSVPALYRAKIHVIVGDEKQLAPNDFFKEKGVDFEGDLEEVETFEQTQELQFLSYKSLLDFALDKYPKIMLSFHYRSTNPELINFSNHKFYEGNLNIMHCNKKSVFPIKTFKVEGGQYIDNVNVQEADLIVKLINKILSSKEYSGKTIGVITFNAAQQKLITQKLEAEADKNTTLLEMLNKTGGESLFIKNIENVQGDERDIIIFSFAFAPRADGRFTNNFGKVGKKGGEKRLNVAITRAKDEVMVVKSIDASLISSDSYEVNIIKDYLIYAETLYNKSISAPEREQKVNTLLLSDTFKNENEITKENQFDSEFEIEVHNEINKYIDHEKFEIITQVPCGKYRIDLGIRDRISKEFVLAIECDGYTYHSSSFDRLRDFERQVYLENRGWTFERILSTHWWAKNKTKKNKFLNAVLTRLESIK